MKSTLRYRTFDALLAEVMGDFTNYSMENLIQPQGLIKTAKYCNKQLGLKINKTKEIILELDYNKVKLPDDFYVFNSGLLCGEYSQTIVMPQGTHIEEVPYPRYQENANVIDTCGPELCESSLVPSTCGGCGTCDKCLTDVVVVPGYNPLKPYGDICVKPRVFMDCKGDSWELIQILQTQTRVYKHFLPIQLVESGGFYSLDCPNLSVRCDNRVWIKDGFLFSSMRSGKIYFNYEGMMEDEDGNLLVLDHDIINNYYERALKVAIYEQLLDNGEDVERKLARADLQLRLAKIEAISIARMPDFDEIKEVWEKNRIIYNSRYVNMFKSRAWYGSRY